MDRRVVMASVVALLLGGGAVALWTQGSEPARTSVLAPATASPPPDPLVSACGHPGATVEVPAERRTVKHADCDLTGVIISHGGSGATVPAHAGSVGGNFDGPSGGSSITIERAPSGDVTYDTRAAESLVTVTGVLVLVGGPAGTSDTPAEGSLEFASPDGSTGGDGTAADGTFRLDLLPGHYTLRGTTPSYDDGRTPCELQLVVGTEDLHDVRLECHRR